MDITVSVLFALLAAAMFGVSSVLQQAAARGLGGAQPLRLGLLWQLLRRPRWVAAFGLTALSFGVQAVALAFGPLALVQPVAATDLLFAIPLIAYRRRQRLRPADVIGGLLVAGGVALFLVLAPPSSGRVAPGTTDWLPVFLGLGAVVLVATPAALRARPPVRTALLAGAAAATFAVVDALTKSVVGLVGNDGASALLHWEPYVLCVVAIGGLFLGQSAFQSGAILISLPIIDSVEPIGAVLIGATVFAERLAASPAVLAAQVLGGSVAVAGIVLLDRSPLMVSLRNDQEASANKTSQDPIAPDSG
ncbi:MAG TPA: DMT family transporter [Acidimicrobiales bacterium]|nr:DMT family transporter [Acidimicrobiales bacterium]